MITVFNRAVLFCDSSAEQAAKVWSALRQAGIAYTVKTGGSGPAKPTVKMVNGGRMGSFSSGASIGSSMTNGTPASWSDGGSGTGCYTIYVHKKDLARAKEVCDL